MSQIPQFHLNYADFLYFVLCESQTKQLEVSDILQQKLILSWCFNRSLVLERMTGNGSLCCGPLDSSLPPDWGLLAAHLKTHCTKKIILNYTLRSNCNIFILITVRLINWTCYKFFFSSFLWFSSPPFLHLVFCSNQIHMLVHYFNFVLWTALFCTFATLHPWLLTLVFPLFKLHHFSSM